MWRGWRGIRLPKECTGSRSVGRPRKRWIEGVFKEKRFGFQASRENGSGEE